MTSTNKKNRHQSIRYLQQHHATANQDGNESNTILIQSKCHCGKVVLDISIPNEYNSKNDSNVTVWNCHCHSCRRYHTAAYVSYLQVPRDQVVSISDPKLIGTYVSSCTSCTSKDNDNNTDTVMERWYCTECSSKLLSVVSKKTSAKNESLGSVQEQSTTTCLINLGPIDADTIPQTHSHQWKEQLKQIENNLHSSPTESSSCPCRWSGVLPSNNTETMSYSARRKLQLPKAKIWSGGCDCGACKYEITLTRLTQLQHCYCNLCRKLSGGPYSSWLPVDKKHFRWKQSSSKSVTLVRTTSVGQRHICNKCRGIMTIVYDDQPNLIWPCAGGLDDATLPDSSDDMGSLLSRVCHICCRNLPPWIELPEDGTEKLPDAC